MPTTRKKKYMRKGGERVKSLLRNLGQQSIQRYKRKNPFNNEPFYKTVNKERRLRELTPIIGINNEYAEVGDEEEEEAVEKTNIYNNKPQNTPSLHTYGLLNRNYNLIYDNVPPQGGSKRKSKTFKKKRRSRFKKRFTRNKN